MNVSRGRAILTNMKIKILIADDNSFIREGMKIILNTYEEFEVVDTVNDGEEAVAYCKSMKLILLFRCSHAKYERGRGDEVHL